jgi:hypothetical protein
MLLNSLKIPPPIRGCYSVDEPVEVMCPYAATKVAHTLTPLSLERVVLCDGECVCVCVVCVCSQLGVCRAPICSLRWFPHYYSTFLT